MESKSSAGHSGIPAATSVMPPSSNTGSAPSMRRSAPSVSTWAMNSLRSSYIGKLERPVDHCGGALEIVAAEQVHFHEEGGAAVELLVLLVPAAEFGADEVPG